MADDKEVLTREVGFKENIAPNGRKLGVNHNRGSHLYNITYIDSKGGNVPNELSGYFTSPKYAQGAIRTYLEKFWNQAEPAKKSRATSG